MRLLQPDGSEAEMCGNGVRCVAKYAVDRGYADEAFVVETGAGPVPVEAGYDDDGFFEATIGMPDPAFDRSGIPALGDGEYLEEVDGLEVRAANTGVPHAVVFVEDLDAVDLEAVAPTIRHHPSFPEGANVNFVQVIGAGCDPGPDVRARRRGRDPLLRDRCDRVGRDRPPARARGADGRGRDRGRAAHDRVRARNNHDRAGRDGLLWRHPALTPAGVAPTETMGRRPSPHPLRVAATFGPSTVQSQSENSRIFLVWT